MKSPKWRIGLPVILICAFCNIALPAAKAQIRPTPNNGHVGVNLDGVSGDSRSKMFVDIAKVARPWTKVGGGTVDVDSNGWPMSDAETVLFDIRPAMTWAPPIDDPAKFQPDWSGDYSASFVGQADVSFPNSGAASVTNKIYNAATNTTSFRINVPVGQGLLVLALTNTRREPTSPPGSGFTVLHVMRPGYALSTHATFTREFLASLAPFSTLRMMDMLDTNHNPGYYGDAGHHALNWNDRRSTSDATQVECGGKYGIAWEYIVELANVTGKDIWINVPVAATDDYVRNLALLLKSTLKPDIKIYIEHSNEVWNFGFPQYIYNKLAAIDEVNAGGSKLNDDGVADSEIWTHRRHAERLIAISNIFRSVYGDAAMMTTIRPVYASWTISLTQHFKDPLDWVQKTYGPPSHFFYGVAIGHYFNAGNVAKTGSSSDILAAMRQNSDTGAATYYIPFIALAKSYTLHPMIYEGGSDTGGGDPANIANRIAAERDPAMKQLIEHDIDDNWLALDGGLYMYFAQVGAYSRYGCWGLTEDIANANTPKYEAIREVVGVRVSNR